jgi:hypothetical protein
MTDRSPTLLHQSGSAEYHDAHLAFARAGIVEAAAHREPLLDRLKTYTDDVRQAEAVRWSADMSALGRDYERALESVVDLLHEGKVVDAIQVAINALPDNDCRNVAK